MAKAQLRTRLSSVLNASRHTVIFHVTVFFCLQQLDALAKFGLCVLRTASPLSPVPPSTARTRKRVTQLASVVVPREYRQMVAIASYTSASENFDITGAHHYISLM